MKNLHAHLLLAAAFGGLLNPIQPVLAQGSLTPPGAPGPTMVTLAQIEPRTPISGTFTITNSGSYYLTTNINTSFFVTTGINIQASGVTLDLNGFSIISSANFNVEPGLGAIELGSGLSDITILNGHIRGGITYNSGAETYSEFGFGDGIGYTGTQPFNVRVTGVSVTGCYYYGINLGNTNSTVVDSCNVQTVEGYGIQASCVFRSTAWQCGDNAINANVVSDCYGFSTAGDGVRSTFTANNCYGLSSGDSIVYGIATGSANNCYGQVTGWGGAEGNSGLSATTATGCTGQNASSVGLAANVALNCYGYSSGDGGFGDNPSDCGLSAGQAQNCYGGCYTGYGVTATVAIGCTGYTTGGGVQYGISSTIASSCTSTGGDGGITYKYNMP